MKPRVLTLAASLVLCLQACGLKGDLYLEKPAEEAAAPTTETATDNEATASADAEATAPVENAADSELTTEQPEQP